MSNIDNFLDGDTSKPGASQIDNFLGDSQPPARGFKGWGRDIAATAVKGAIGVPETLVGLADIPTGGAVGKFLENENGTVGFRPKQAKELVNDWHSDATKAAQQKFQNADGFVDKAVTAIQNPSLIATAVGESLPLMGAGGVAARGLMTATKLGQMGAKGAAIAGGLGEGATMAGSAAEQIRQETPDGRLTPTQSGLALATGALGTAFGIGGGKLASRLGVGDVDTMIAQGSKGMAREFADDAAGAAAKAAANPLVDTAEHSALRSIPASIIKGAISEGFLEELPQSVAEQVLQNIALGKDWSKDVDAAAVMGVLSGGAMGGAAAGFHGYSRPEQPAAGATSTPASTANATGANQPTTSPGLDRVRQAYAAQLQALQDQEQGDPSVPQTTPPDGAAVLAQQRAQKQAEIDAAIAESRAVTNPDDEIFQSTRADGQTPIPLQTQDYLAQVRQAVRSGTKFTTQDTVNAVRSAMEDAWLAKNVSNEPVAASSVAPVDAANNAGNDLQSEFDQAGNDLAIAANDARVRTGRILSGLQNIFDAGADNTIQAIVNLNRGLEKIGDPRLDKEEVARVRRMSDSYFGFRGATQAANLPGSGQRAIPDAYADNASLEGRIKERKPSEIMGLDPAKGSLSAGAAIAVNSDAAGQMQRASQLPGVAPAGASASQPQEQPSVGTQSPSDGIQQSSAGTEVPNQPGSSWKAPSSDSAFQASSSRIQDASSQPQESERKSVVYGSSPDGTPANADVQGVVQTKPTPTTPPAQNEGSASPSSDATTGADQSWQQRNASADTAQAGAPALAVPPTQQPTANVTQAPEAQQSSPQQAQAGTSPATTQGLSNAPTPSNNGTQAQSQAGAPAQAETPEQRAQRVASAGQTWDGATPDARKAIALRAPGLLTIQRNNIASKPWSDLHAGIKSIVADAMQPKSEPTSTPVDTPAVPSNSVQDSVDKSGRQASWVIRNKETGKVIMETFDQKKVEALNAEKYEAVPAAKYLASITSNLRRDSEKLAAAAKSVMAPSPAAPAPAMQAQAAAVNVGREGYDTPVELDAKILKSIIEKTRGEPIVNKPLKLEAWRNGTSRTDPSKFPIELSFNSDGLLDVNDGRHRIALAAERGEKVTAFIDGKDAKRAIDFLDATQAQAAAVAPAANPQAAVTPAKTGKKLSVKSGLEAFRKARAEYFTPGNVLPSYGGTFDRVVSYTPPDSKGDWSAEVQEVEPDGNGGYREKRGAPVRVHSTNPSEKELNSGPKYRAPAPVEAPSPVKSKPKPRKDQEKSELARINKNMGDYPFQTLDEAKAFFKQQKEDREFYEDITGSDDEISYDDDANMSDGDIEKFNERINSKEKKDKGPINVGGWTIDYDKINDIYDEDMFSVVSEQGFIYRGLNNPGKQAVFHKNGDVTLISGVNFDSQMSGVSMTPYKEVAIDYATRTENSKSRQPNGVLLKITKDFKRSDLTDEGDHELAWYGGPLTLKKGEWELIENPSNKSAVPTGDAAVATPVASKQAGPDRRKASDHLGVNSQPISEGGKPFKTRETAKKEKNKHPTLRVVKVKDGFVLAPKTALQLAADEAKSKRLSQPNTSPAGEPIPAHAFIAASGSLNKSTRNDLGIGNNPRIGNRTLFAASGGLTIEQATEKLIDEQYLPEGASHNDAYALIRKSLTTPQYNSDGIERIAQAEQLARYGDYLAAQEEDSQADPFDSLDALDLTEDDAHTSGYDESSDPIKMEVNALLAQADALGIDTETIKEEAHEATRNGSEQDYFEAQRSQLQAAIRQGDGGRSNQADAGANPEQGREAAVNQGGADRGQDAGQQGSAAEPILTSPTREEIEAKQDRADAEAKKNESQRLAAEVSSADDENHKRIAKLSEAASSTFTLGGDAMDNLTGQKSVFDAPAEQEPKAVTPPEVKPAPGYTSDDAKSAEDQLAQQLGEIIDKMTAGDVNKIAARYLPDVGLKATVSKVKNKAMLLDFTIANPFGVAAEFGFDLPDSIRGPLEAKYEGRLTDASEIEQKARETKLFEKLYQLAAEYERAVAHRESAIANGSKLGSSAFDWPYQGKTMTVDRVIELLKTSVQDDSKSPDYAKVSAMVRKMRPEIFKAVDGEAVENNGRDAFTLSRLNQDTGKMEPVTFERGEYVSVALIGSDSTERGEIDGISQAQREFSVDGRWHPFGAAYKAERPAAPAPKTVPMSSVIDAVNKKNGEGLTDADRVFSTKQEAEQALWERINAGTVTPDEFKAGFEKWLKNKDAIIAELTAQKKDDLLARISPYMRSRYKSDAKPAIAQALWQDSLGNYALGASVTYGLAKDSYQNAVRRMVDAADAARLKQYADEVKAQQEQMAQRLKDSMKAIEDPKTLADYEALIRAKAKEADVKTLREALMLLTPEQRAKYDELAADKSRKDRSYTQDTKQSVRVAGQTVDATIIETKHTQKGHDLFVVQLAERVERGDYDALNASAKKIGGYYSSFRGRGATPGFQFTNKATAEAFVKLANGDSTDAQAAADSRRDAFADDRSQSAAERLTEMADRMDAQADESLNYERKTNTARRASFASAAEAEARSAKAMAKTMRNIAKALATGNAKYLDKIRTKTQIDALQSYVSRAQYEQLKSKYPTYAEQEKRRGQPPNMETADFAEFPQFTAFRSDLASLARQMIAADGTKLMGQRLMKVVDDVSDAFMKFAKENPGRLMRYRATNGAPAAFSSQASTQAAIDRSGYRGKAIPFMLKRGEWTIITSPSEAIAQGLWTGDGDKRITLSAEFGAELVEKIGKANRRGAKVSVPWQFESSHDKRNMLARMGIETPAELRSALREFIGLREQAAEADRVKMLERSMVGRKNDGLDFFPTPASVADEMIAAADIQPDMAVLEPSAGMGHIADRIRETGAEPDVIEMASDRQELLKEKGFTVIGSDFMEMEPRGFTYGDVFKHNDGRLGVLGSNGGIGSGRYRFIPMDGDPRTFTWENRDELTGVEKRGSSSGYDRIIMNPPFSDGRDMAHVQHAYTLLKPGGRIVALMGESAFTNQNKRATEFRSWLERVGGTDEKLAEGSFLDPSLPVNTGANARMVVIEKPAQEQTPAMSRSRPLRDFTKTAMTQDIKSVEATVRGLTSGMENAPNVVVALDMNDPAIPDAVRRADKKQRSGGATGTPEGFFHNGTVYLIASKLTTPDDVARVFAHEALGHYGLRGVFGDGLKPILQQIATMRKAEVDAKIKEYGLRGVNSVDRLTAAEEVLAEMAQKTPTIGFVTRTIAAIRTWLRANVTGLSALRLSDAEIIRSYILPARNFVERGVNADAGAVQAAFSRGKNDAMTNSNVVGNQGGRSADDTTPGVLKDSTGKPLVVYHGTPRSFDKFEAKHISSGMYGEGFYFTNLRDDAELYAEGGRVIEANLLIKNPASREVAEEVATRIGEDDYTGIRKELQRIGYDGVIAKGEYAGEVIYVAFKPDQIIPNESPEPTSDGAQTLFSRSSIQGLKSSALDQINRRETVIAGETGRTYTPEIQAAMRNVGFMVERPSLKERAQALWQDAGKKMAQGIVDQFAPVKEISKDAYALLRLSKGSSGAFETLLKGGKLKLSDGVYDFDDANKGGVVEALLTPLNGEHHDFLRWVAANRAERLMGEDREHLFTKEDIAALKTLTDGDLSFDFTLKNGIRKGQTTRSRAEAYRDSLATFNAFNKNVMDMAEQSGLIDPESRATWESEFYVPFYRVADEESGGVRGMNIKGSVVRQQAFKHLKGGKQALNNDLLDNTLMNWAHLLDASAKNRAAKATLEAAAQVGAAIEAPKYTLDQIGSSIGKKNGVVWFMDEGKKRHFMVDDPYLLTAISSLEYAGMNSPIMNALGSFKHALTIGVTASPFFKVRNLIRDSIQVIGSGPIGYNPAKNIAQGWKLTDPKADAYFKLLAGGGTIHFGTMLEGSESKRIQALVESGVDESTILNNDQKVKAFFRKFIEPGISAYNELGNRGEAVNRAALYDQLVKQGKSHAEASLMARDLMDFSMQGSFTTVRFLSQVVPFFNARLQGMYKLGRAAKEDPKRMAYVTGAVAMASLALMAGYGGDDDWKKREDWDRNNFWWFKFGDMAFRIPKPFEIGAIGTLAERSAEYLMDDEMTGKRFRDQVLALLGDNLSMNPIPQAVKPIMDVYANKDSFKGTPIENMGMERLKSEYRFNDRTSMTARATSTALNSVTGLVGKEALSPVQVDHLIRGYFGWLGTFAVSTADMIARTATSQPVQATPDYWRMATGGMVSDLRDAPSRYVSSMYDQSKALEQAYGTWHALRKSGKTEEAAQFLDENRKEITRYPGVQHIKTIEGKMNERIRQIEQSNMDPDAKREAIRSIRVQKEGVAKNLAGAT